MERNVTEIPDKWVVLKIPNGYKVFGTWFGDYLTGDSWRINSGIKEIVDDEHYYYFIGFSGSCYKCHKNSYGTTNFGSCVLDNILTSSNGSASLMSVETDWLNLIK